MDETDRTGLRPPIRTCVGCRRTDSRSALLRVVAATAPDGSPVVVPDPARRAGGRGAWLHPRLECFEQAIRRRAFGRALRSSVPLDPAPVLAHLEEREQRPSEQENRKRV
ncbi:YlxR family protein [Nostocoides japonicum]|nr:YlxR family protein [Tetrasphaera japonica]